MVGRWAWAGAGLAAGLGACHRADPEPTEPTEPTDTDTDGDGPAALASLTLDGAALFPPFDGGGQAYGVVASTLGPETHVLATATDPAATVTLRWQTVDGEPLDDHDGGDVTWALAPDQRLVIEVASGADLEQTTVSLVPSELPLLAVAPASPTGPAPSPGYVFTASFDFATLPPGMGRYAMIADTRGVPVWWRETPSIAFDFRVAPTGALSMLSADGGAGLHGVVLDPVTHATDAAFYVVPPADMLGLGGDPHEFTALPDGHAIAIGTGARVEDLTAWGGGPTDHVVDQVAQELDADGDVVFQWSTAGHLDYADLPTALVALIPGSQVGLGWEYAHLNAVDIDPDDGAWIVSLRLASQVVKVARAPMTVDGVAYAPGDVVWRLGGPASDFTFVDDDRENGWTGFSEQHSARMLGGGQLLVFDNASSLDHGSTGDARGVAYQLDTDVWTATKLDAWTIGHGPTAAGGSIQRLPDGHTAIGWGNRVLDGDGAQLPVYTEFDADGAIALELSLPGAQWSYRVWRFDGDPLLGLWSPPSRAGAALR